MAHKDGHAAEATQKEMPPALLLIDFETISNRKLRLVAAHCQWLLALREQQRKRKPKKARLSS